MKQLILSVVLVCAGMPAFASEFGVTRVLDVAGKALTNDVTGGTRSNANFIVGEADKRASVKWASKGANSVFSFEVSVPANDNGATTVGTLDGLSGSNKVSLNYKRTAFPMAGDIRVAHSTCVSMRSVLGMTKTTGCSIEDVIAEAGKKEKQGILTEAELETVTRAIWGRGPVYFYGLSGSYGEESFKFVDVGSLAKESETEYGWSAGFYFGVVLNAASVWSLEYKREQSYSDQDEGVLCDNTVVTTPLTCVSGPLGRPKEKETDITTLQYRGRIGKQTIAPKISYDAEEETFGFSLPVYLFKNEKSNLSGGYSLDWNDEDDEWSFGIFVDSEFKFFNQ